MNHKDDSLKALIKRIERKAPEYLDLMCAETDEEFSLSLLPLLEKAVNHLEANVLEFKPLGEVGLSGILCAWLSIPGLTVIQEAYSKGHVDLTITADHNFPMRKILVEAKIYKGFDYHISGLEQLLKRYITGREGQGIIIEYFKRKNIDGLMIKLRKNMDAVRPLNQSVKSADHNLKWSFSTTHKHSSGSSIKIHHIGCNLCAIK